MKNVFQKIQNAKERGLEEYQLLNTKDLAELLSMKPSTIRYWRHIGEGPNYFKLGRTPRYRLIDVMNWIDGHLNEA